MWTCGNMIFEFKKFYDVGTHLKNYSNEEEYQRSSISRYYYSVFHQAKEYYETSFRRILPSNNIHSELIKELENSPFEEENKLGQKIRKLRNDRNYADYNDKKLRKNQVIKSKDKTDDILLQLDQLKKHPLRLRKNPN